jgi:hypothetical protein
MQYQIIVAGSVPQLQSLVNFACARGWIPSGGVAPLREENRSVFLQAMTREINQPKGNN